MKRILKIVAIVVGVLILIAIAIPFFIDANTFRPTLESNLTSCSRPAGQGGQSVTSPARGCSIGGRHFHCRRSGVQQIAIRASEVAQGGRGDDAADFLEELNVTELTLNQPDISLVRSQNGEKWNFSSLGGNNTVRDETRGFVARAIRICRLPS